MQVHLSIKSSNDKTGPIPVSTTTRESCPVTCPVRKKGCYADGGPLALHWDAVTAQKRGSDWQTFCRSISKLPAGQLWRHNQAGDLPGDGVRIDADRMMQLVGANAGKRGFTYTHHIPTVENLSTVRAANRAGFTVNLSGNSLSHADNLKEIAPDLPVVAIVPSDRPCPKRTPGGRAVVQCPATTEKGIARKINCKDCGLCQIACRNSVIAFPSHGNRKAIVSQVARG